MTGRCPGRTSRQMQSGCNPGLLHCGEQDGFAFVIGTVMKATVLVPRAGDGRYTYHASPQISDYSMYHDYTDAAHPVSQDRREMRQVAGTGPLRFRGCMQQKRGFNANVPYREASRRHTRCRGTEVSAYDGIRAPYGPGVRRLQRATSAMRGPVSYKSTLAQATSQGKRAARGGTSGWSPRREQGTGSHSGSAL